MNIRNKDTALFSKLFNAINRLSKTYPKNKRKKKQNITIKNESEYITSDPTDLKNILRKHYG